MFETPEHNTAQVTELSTDELDLVAGGANTATTGKPKNSAPPSSGVTSLLGSIATDNELANFAAGDEVVKLSGATGLLAGIQSGLSGLGQL